MSDLPGLPIITSVRKGNINAYSSPQRPLRSNSSSREVCLPLKGSFICHCSMQQNSWRYCLGLSCLLTLRQTNFTKSYPGIIFHIFLVVCLVFNDWAITSDREHYTAKLGSSSPEQMATHKSPVQMNTEN